MIKDINEASERTEANISGTHHCRRMSSFGVRISLWAVIGILGDGVSLYRLN